MMLQETIISIYKENPHYFAINGKAAFFWGVESSEKLQFCFQIAFFRRLW